MRSSTGSREIRGFESNADLVAFAKKMKARQYARMLEYEDEDTGMRIKRLWSFRDQVKGGRFYADILEMPEADRKRLIASTPASRASCAPSARRWPITSPASGSSTFTPNCPTRTKSTQKKPAPRHATSSIEVIRSAVEPSA